MVRDKLSGIYCIENKLNGKKYIGQSINIYKRWSSHKRELRNSNHCNNFLSNSWNKYGEENFRFYILETCSCDMCDELEKEYIKEFNTTKQTNGYNISNGGSHTTYSKEQRDKLSKMKTKIEGRPILSVDIWNGKICFYDGLRPICRESCFSQGAILDSLKRRRVTAYEKIWFYQDEIKDDTNPLDILNSSSTPRKIQQYDLNGVFIREFAHSNKTKDFGFDPSSILKCCKGKYKTSKGYVWKFSPWFNGVKINSIDLKNS